jgi:hypothetical protein
VVKTAQAFRPYVLDMFEPQNHPDDVPYPGGPPRPPYDHAGWTLAYQMGVKFDRVLDGFTGPFEPVTHARPAAGGILGAAQPAGYLVSHHQNDAFVVVNRLLAAGADVYWLRDRRAGGDAFGGTGAIYIASTPSADVVIHQAAADLGLAFTGVEAAPAGEAWQLSPVRVGLWDRYGGASTSGWMRWMLEQYEFPHELVFAQVLDAGDLASRFDVIVLPGEAVPGRAGAAPRPERVPPEYRATVGSISWDRTVPELRRFVEQGGTLLAIGQATVVAERLGVPVTSALTTPGAGASRPLSPAEFYVPGSVLRARVDGTTPIGFGFEPEVDVFFDASPAFRLERGASRQDVRVVAWYESAAPLRSGWALGQHHLEGAAAVVDARVGAGRVVLFGPGIVHRAQPHGTFKFLFNGIHAARATPVAMPGAVRAAASSRP